MIIKALIEDNMSDRGLTPEHGICIYVKTAKHSVLIDTGQSSKTWDNAKKLGTDLKGIDTIVLTHGHYDHTGGLPSFPYMDSGIKVYMRDNADGDFYNCKDVPPRYIGINKDILKLSGLIKVSGDYSIDDELSLFTGVKGRRLWPEGNKILSRKEKDIYIQDDFSHEQYLVIKDEDGRYILVSGCAHNGILNILDRFKDLYGCDPKIVISGFHMVRDKYSQSDIINIRKTAKELVKTDTSFYTGHCTGDIAFDIMKEEMGENLKKIKDLK